MSNMANQMIRRAQRIRALLLSSMVCVAVLSAGHTAADDTEVFFGSAASAGETRPNVLLVLDTSGSMGARDGLPQSRMDRMKDAVRRMLESDIDMNIGLMQYSGVYGGGAVLYPVTPLDDIVCTGANCKTPTLADNVYRVAGALDDVEQRVTDGSVSTDGNVLSLGYTGLEAANVGLRYPDINISRGATILKARLEFVAVSEQTDPASLIVKIEDTNNAEPFTVSNNAVSGRTFVANGVGWEADEWFPDTTYESPDVSELVQGIISRDDWCTGGAMAFSVEWATMEATGTREAFSFEKATTDGVDYMPRLTIVQDPATVVVEDNCGSGSVTLPRSISQGSDDVEQYNRTDRSEGLSIGSTELDVGFDKVRGSDVPTTIGLRFQNITIPKDAVIESAFIEFTRNKFRNGSMGLRIFGEVDANPPTYSSSNSPRERSNFTSPVLWPDVPVMNRGNEKVSTPDLKSIVETLVSLDDWVSGNALAFQMVRYQGSGRRSFRSIESSGAPKLTITYSVAGSGTGTGTGPSGPYVPAPILPTTSTSKARDEMLDIVDGLVATGGTPGVDSYYEAALYMRGEPVDYGRTRGLTGNAWKRERFRVSSPRSYTGGSVVRNANCTDTNLSSSACRDEEIIGDAIYTTPIAGSCQANHIVLLSDGDTDRNSVTTKIKDMIGKSSCSPTANKDEACATDLATWLNTTDHSSTFNDAQKIKTHTIAFNLEGSGKEFMRRIAIAGGGEAYEADTSDELLGVFNDIAANVADVETGFTAPSATVNQFNRLTNRKDIYFALFKPSATHAWDGNLKKFNVSFDNNDEGEVLIRDKNGAPAIDGSTGFFADNALSYWPEKDDADQQLPKPDGSLVARGGAANQIKLTGLEGGIGDRRVYTWLGDSSSDITTPIPLKAAAHKLHESNSLITDGILGIAGARADSDDQEAYRESLIKWARGVDVLDSDEDGSTDDARRQMGDPMHSRPVIVNYAPASGETDSRSLVFVGTNQGFLHAIDTENGEEQFSFIPKELLGNLKSFYANGSGFDRPYGLDGALSVWREDRNDNLMVDSGESAYLFVGMRRGGTSYYALDISDPESPKLAWTINGGAGGSPGFESMGQSWSRLTPVKMHINGFAQDVLIFGGGYDENQDRGNVGDAARHTTDSKGAGIYIVSATTGERLWSGLGKLGSQRFDSMDYGFNSHIRAIDIDRDGLVDQMYAADAGGQVWRFDMVQGHVSGDLVHGGVIADFSASAASAHRRFYNEPDVSLIETGGERFLSISIGSGWRAHPLDETTQDRFYMVRQYAVYEKPEGYGKQDGGTYTPITDSDLVNVSSTVNPATNTYGWYLDFTTTGEKVLGTSVTFDGKVIFSTYVPTVQTAVCSPEIGSGRAYIMDVATGAPAVDLDNSVDPDTGAPSNVLTLSDRSADLRRGGIPPEAMILITEGSLDEPQVLFGGEQLETGIINRTRRTFWSDQGESGAIIVAASEDADGGEEGHDGNGNNGNGNGNNGNGNGNGN